MCACLVIHVIPVKIVGVATHEMIECFHLVVDSLVTVVEDCHRVAVIQLQEKHTSIIKK